MVSFGAEGESVGVMSFVDRGLALCGGFLIVVSGVDTLSTHERVKPANERRRAPGRTGRDVGARRGTEPPPPRSLLKELLSRESFHY